MNFHVLSLFPCLIKQACGHSILKRAADSGLITLNCVDIRDFADNKHGQADDAPYGGGAGMVMMAAPIYNAFNSIGKPNARFIYMSPQGKPFNQRLARDLSTEKDIIILCGHYEGVDQRVLDILSPEEISIGDYVLTGGEIGALVIIDAVARLLPGVLGKEESAQNESFSPSLKGGLEYPHYTRPREFMGLGVPEILLSGHHKQIEAWRKEMSRERTKKIRPDLLEGGSMKIRWEPARVLGFFQAISAIPRGSGNEKAVSDYFVSFAKERGLEVVQDAAYNVVIYKPGSKGHESRPALILQSHMDMVCEKNAGTEHDFLKDPIKLRVDGDFVYATDTTLGADNGVGVAVGLALLDSQDLAHPPLEVVFTAEEETTMKGVSALEPSLFKARRMINMDSGSDTTFCVGCAGGGRFDFSVPLAWEEIPAGHVSRLITVRGLLGGHSGGEIHTGKANSIRTLGRALAAIKAETGLRISDVSGGLKANAIPREAEAIVTLPASDIGKAEGILKALESTLRSEHRLTDPDISLAMADSKANQVIKEANAEKLIQALLLLPYGVFHMSFDIPGLVETSNNIGVMRTDKERVSFDCALRSAVPSRKDFAKAQIEALAKALDVNVTFSHGYPGWTYNPDSKLLAEAMAAFKEMYEKDAKVEAVHGGLECGFMLEKFPDMDIISYCCEIFDAHTPNEHMSLPSLERMWKYTVALMEKL